MRQRLAGRQPERTMPEERKKGGAAGGLAAPPKGGHVFMNVTSGRKQDTGKTGSVIRNVRDNLLTDR